MIKMTVRLTSDKNIIQKSENATLTATVTDDNNNPIANTEVNFYKKVNFAGYCQSITQKFNQLSNLLIAKLHNCYVEKTTNESFTELIEAVGEINAVETENSKNTKPTNIPIIDNSNISIFYITLKDRVIYYMQLLAYFLVLKGVPRETVNAQTDLKGLIELIDMIDVIKPTVLTVSAIDTTQYYGNNIVIPYTLKDIDGVDITQGDITVQDSNGTTYTSVEAGKPLLITPLYISDKIGNEYQYITFTIVYNGTEKYTASNTETIQLKILPAKIKLIVDIINTNTKSRYYNSNSTGYETDEWNITISTFNHQNQPLPDIPINFTATNQSNTHERNITLSGGGTTEKDKDTTITATIVDEDDNPVIGANVDFYTDILDLQTDENGVCSFTKRFNQAGHYLINCATDYEDTEKMGNTDIDYEINIKYNIIKQSVNKYTDYTGKNQYTYNISLVDEDTGLPTSTYDGNRIQIFLDNEQVGATTITNKQASYTFTELSVGEKIVKWTLTNQNFTTEAVTYLNILSNFILPEQESYFLNTTPVIQYRPNGSIGANTNLSGTISYVQDDTQIGYQTEIVQVLIGYEYDDETGEYFIPIEPEINEKNIYLSGDNIIETGTDANIIATVLDEDGNPVSDINVDFYMFDDDELIPIYETQEREILDTNGNPIPIYNEYNYVDRPITILTDSNGNILLSDYLNIGNYEIDITSSNNLDETVNFKYKLKEPFDVELIYYNKTEEAQYKITIFDETNNYNITITNQNNIIDSSLYSLVENPNQTYNTYILTIPISENTMGTNNITITQNGYTYTTSFKFISQSFTLLTSNVTLGEDILQIQCNDADINSIELESEYINMLDFNLENNIFTITAEFLQAGTIQFNAIGNDLTSETFNITVNKVNLTNYIETNIGVHEPEDESTVDDTISTVDIDKAQVFFTISNVLYSDLSIKYAIKQGNNELSTQTFTYYKNTENNDFTLLIPTLSPGTYKIVFIYYGDNNYINFNVEKEFTIAKTTPTHNITSQHTTFKDMQFFIYEPEFTEENPETLIRESCSTGVSSQSNGIWNFVGYYLAEGWANTGLWECDFDISGDIRYVGFDILCAISSSNQITRLITGWEGPIATNPSGIYTRDNDNTLNFLPKKLAWSDTDTTTNTSTFTQCHINMKKTSPTTLVITKTNGQYNNGSVTYEWQNLSNYPKLTIGAHVNPNLCDRRGTIKIENFIVRGVY